MVDSSFIEGFNTLRIKLRDNWEPSPSLDNQLDWCTFPTWATRFITALKTSSEKGKSVDLFMDEITKAKTNRQRVSIVLNNDIMREKMEASVKNAMGHVGLCSVVNPKCIDQSRNYMRQGSDFFKQNQFKEAFECFDKGVCISPFPFDVQDAPSSSNLAMCLVKRSRCYQKLKKYPESWCDLKDAIANMPDERLAEQLLKSKRALLAEITSDTDQPCVDEELPDMDFSPMDVWIRPENRNLHGTSESLEISFSEEKGRHIIASRAIRPGTNVIAESPFAAWLQPSDYTKYCAHCLRPLENRSFPCRQCTTVSYCSSTCSEAAWFLYHSVECTYLPILRHLSMGHLALRVLLTAGFKTALEAHERPAPPARSQRKFTNTYRDIRTLMDSIEVFDKIKVSTFTTCAVYMAMLTHSMGIAKKESVNTIADLYLKTIIQIVLNGLAIYDDRANADSGIDFSCYTTVGGRKIGVGLYATSSLLSHSCDANTDRIFIGSKVVFNTRCVVQKGQELTICYGPSKLEGYKKRQKELKDNFYFTCRCDVCKMKQ